jgi:hypothetical protein
LTSILAAIVGVILAAALNVYGEDKWGW